MFFLKKIINLILSLFITQPKQKKLLLPEKQVDKDIGPYRSMNKEKSEESDDTSLPNKSDALIEVSSELLTADKAISIYNENYDNVKNSAIILWKKKIEPTIKANAKEGIKETYVRENNKTLKEEIEKIATSLGYSIKNCILPDDFIIYF